MHVGAARQRAELANVPVMFHPSVMRSLPDTDPRRRPARGAGCNPAGRFDPHVRLPADPGGWDMPEPPPLRTEVREERTGRALSRNASPDIGFDRALNPYRGCEHGCIYCYARPGHAYLGLSPGLDFETRLVARPWAPAALAREFSAGGYRPAPVMLGAVTDPYQPLERDRGITRALLEVLREFRHPVVVTTRGTLIERDIDILSEMAAHGLAAVGISVTTLDAGLARAMEPRAPAPARRLATMRRLAEAGVPVRVMASPVIPALTDHEIEAILAAARDAGAVAASTILLRLPHEVAPLFRDWLARHVPGRAEAVMARLRTMRGGRENDPRFGTRMTGEGAHAQLLQQRFALACRRLGLVGGMPPLRRDLFRVPPRPGDQLELF
jgi:DNA repair photolyase